MSFDLTDVWNASDDAGFEQKAEGVYLAEVTEAKSHMSQAGNASVIVYFKDVADGKIICRDRLMLAGKPFALKLTREKLKALGYSKATLDVFELVGLRVRICVKLGSENDKGKRYLEVDTFDCPDDFRFGYQPVAKKAATVAAPPAPVERKPKPDDLSDVFGSDEAPF